MFIHPGKAEHGLEFFQSIQSNPPVNSQKITAFLHRPKIAPPKVELAVPVVAKSHMQVGSGASLTYYDFGAMQEVNVTTSGQNPRLQTPGNSVNILVKQATNRFRGQGAFYGTNDNLQATNIDDDLREQGAGAGTPTKSGVPSTTRVQ